MKGYNIVLDKYELGIVINAVNEYRTEKIKEGIETDCIDELLIKLVDLYEKKCPLLKHLNKDYAR